MITELIYAGKDAEELIKSRYPTARIQDASDDVHPERFEVEVDTSEDDFYPFAIAEGFALWCFNFQIMMRMGEHIRIKRWMKMREAGIQIE